VGERVRHKEQGTVWKVIEEKEFWLPHGTEEKEARRPVAGDGLIPAISLRYWREDPASPAGTGKTLSCRYSAQDCPFQKQWEILYDW